MTSLLAKVRSVSVQVVVLALLAATVAVVGAASPAAAVEAPPAFASEWGSFGGVPKFPIGVAVDPATGDIYVSESILRDRILKFDSNGASLSELGSFGSGQGQFNGPRGVAVDPSTGDLYVADSNNHRVLRFDSNGAYLSQFGTSGSGDGEFTFPQAVAVDPSTGDVYVTDNMYGGQPGDRVQKFDSNGTYLTQWGGFDLPIFGWIGFDSPRAIAVDPATGNVYVADGDAVLRFDSDGASLSVLGYSGSGNGEFDGPAGVAVDPSTGDVYVAESGNERIQKFDSNGAYLTQWGTATGLKPGHLAVDPSTGDVLVPIGNWSGGGPVGRVQRFDSTGALLSDQFLSPGSGRFDSPLGVDVAPSTGDVYVADPYNHRVQRFDSNGAYLSQFGSRGSGPGEFDQPGDVDIDGSGNIYVAEYSRVQKFDPTGAFIFELSSLGSGSGGFEGAGVGVNASTGDVYVTDSNNNRVQRFDSNGAYLSQFATSGAFCRPQDVAVDDSGDVYVADYCGARVQKFDSNGTYLTEWGTFGDGPGEFSGPTDVEIDGSGDVYVADPFNDRVQKFDSNGDLLALWGTSGTGPGEFDHAWGVAANPSTGDVYVTDSRNDRVQKFTSASSPTGVSGTVTEQGSGAPVAGAWVAVLRTSDFSIAGGAAADGSGNYAAEVPPGSYYLYVVDPSGAHTAGFHGPPTTVTVTAGAMTDADPQMASLRGSIAGTVTEAGSGTPVGGAWVIGINATTGATQQGVVANGSGQYNIAGLRAGSYRPVFVDPTGAHASRYFPNSVDFLGATSLAVTAGGSTVANVALPSQSTTPGAQTLSGTVREAGTNTALGGVFVVALRASDFRNAGGAVTNGSGQYSLNVAAGDYKLAFVDSTGGHNMEWHDNQPNTGLATATSVTAPAVTDAALDANTGSMAGTVTDDPSGDPLVGAWVVAIGPTGAIAGGAVTAPDGTYTIAGLAPGTYRATIVDPNGGRTQEYYNNSPDYAGSTPINITAANTASIDAALALP